MTDEQNERLKQIRERRHAATLPANQRGLLHTASWVDIDFLLSMLDSQAVAADTVKLTGFGKPEDEARRILTYAKDWIGEANYRVLHTEIVKSVDGLYSELDQAKTERDELRLVVDATTDDNPGTALSKLHKIQHDAATAMRNACVEKVREYLTDCRDEERGIIEAIASELQSLTLDQVEQEK